MGARSVLWKNIFTNVLLLGIGASLGYGFSQQYVVSDVREHAVEIRHLQADRERIDANINALEQTFTSRIAALSSLLERSIAQNNELITILRTEHSIHRGP